MHRLAVIGLVGVAACGGSGTKAAGPVISAGAPSSAASVAGTPAGPATTTDVTGTSTTAADGTAESLPPATPAPVGAPTGEPVSQTIGATGGSVSADDGRVVVTIPAGALAAETSISIQPTTNTAPNGFGVSYHLSPDGTTFAQPVRISIGYTEADVEGSAPEALGVAFQDEQGMWEWQPDVAVDAAARRLTVMTTHFSTWSGVPGLQLRPRAASVKLKKQVTLFSAVCLRPAGTKVFVGECVTAPHGEARPGTLKPDSWAVNGAPRGTTGIGTVEGNSGAGVYTAPARKPTAVSSKVSVSAQAYTTAGKLVLLSSSITIIGDAYRVQGTLTLSGSGLVCAGAISDTMSDAVEFSLTPGPDGLLTVTDIKNTTTTFTPPRPPPGFPATPNVLSPPELFDAASGTVTASQQLVTVAMVGTRTIGSCTYGGQVTGPAQTDDYSAGTTFETANFVGGTQTGRPDINDPWVWTITEQ